VTVIGPSAVCKLGYSIDGRNFTAVGSAYTASKVKWIGAKFGLFASKPFGSAIGGYADFAWINVNNGQNTKINRDVPSESAVAGRAPIAIKSNFPGTISVDVALHERARVSMELYNAIGEKVEVLEDRIHDKGAFLMAVHRGSHSAGIYFVKVIIGTRSYMNRCRFF
jgi:hypothetical protein